MKVTIICANDSMELAFLPNTEPKIIEQQWQKIEEKYIERYKHQRIPPSIYVHLHEVDVFTGEPEERRE